MNTLLLALRNLLRNRRRSFATLVAMIIGGACLLLFGGYIRNIVYGLQTGYVRGGGHLQLHRRGYDVYGSGDPTAYGIPDYAAVIDAVRNDAVLAPLLTVVTPTLEFGGIAGNFEAGVSRTVMAIGTVADDQNVLQRWNDYGFPGAPEVSPLTGTAPDAVVIGTGVARVLLCRPLHLADCPPPARCASRRCRVAGRRECAGGRRGKRAPPRVARSGTRVVGGHHGRCPQRGPSGGARSRDAGCEGAR